MVEAGFSIEFLLKHGYLWCSRDVIPQLEVGLPPVFCTVAQDQTANWQGEILPCNPGDVA